MVTFFPERLIRTYIAESVLEACRIAWHGDTDERVARNLLHHKEQRFRLSYLIGSWAPDGSEEREEDDWGEQTDPEAQEDEEDARSLPTAEERAAMQEELESYVRQIRHLAKSADENVSEELEQRLKKLTGEDKEAAVALLLEEIEKSRSFGNLTDEIFQMVLSRFDYVCEGKLTKRRGWPEKWVFGSSDRNTFIRQVRWFSSNYHKEYGRLLTPLVQGIRIKGPFVPENTGNVPRFVLIDGEGLGHTPESAANVSTHYTSRYRDVDVILLVDNAKQPMQAAPLSVLRSVANSGYEEKLALAFTHFDAVRGDNLAGFRAKRDHIVDSVRSALSGIREAVGDVVTSGLERHLERRCFMLGWLDKPGRQIPSGVKKQLGKLKAFFQQAVEPEALPEARPLYDPAGLAFAVQSAAIDFHSLWNARLGYRHVDGISKEHWARVKALNRRVVLRIDNYEYRHLMPIAELIARLSEGISRFLDSPVGWDQPAMNDEEAAAAIGRIRSRVYTELHPFALNRIVEQHFSEWSKAFSYYGRGSSTVRASELRRIFEEAVPIPQSELSQVASRFLRNVRKLVVLAIKEGWRRTRARGAVAPPPYRTLFR